MGEQRDTQRLEVSWLWVFGCLFGFVFIPPFIFWCWACVEFNQGQFILPNSLSQEDVLAWWQTSFVDRLKYAIPSERAVVAYLSWLAFQAVLFKFAPGLIIKGKTLADGKTRLNYKVNGHFAFAVTNITMFALHWFEIFRITELCDLFPQFMTMANITCVVVIGLIHIHSVLFDMGNRRTNSFFYNFFMGVQLNPGAQSGFDIKYYFELRPGIMMWWFTTVGIAVKMYEEEGWISSSMALLVFFHLCFVNACYKGEQCVCQTLDIVYENFGWMLMMLDIVMVPFVFPLQTYYLYKMGPFEHPVWYTVAVALMHIIGYWMFDTANSQKDYFRERKGEEVPKGFPRLPWDELHDPKYIPTERGTKLLISGWWKYARHMNYTGDMLMSWAWGLICGTSSYFPFAYTTYLTPLLIHRERRDDHDCRVKYGKDWDKYCEAVPYRFFPYVW